MNTMFLPLVINITRILAATAGQEQENCRTVGSTSNTLISGHVLRTIHDVTQESCIFKCEYYPQCFSVNYYHVTHKCELNGRSRRTNPCDVTTQSGVLYIESLRCHGYDACTLQPCMNGGICEAIATCPGYICRCGTNFTGIHCEDCNQRGNALGMESHLIPDDAITASSFEPAYQPYSGRLNAKGWIALANDTGNPYFQVRFGQEKIVSKVIIQGVLGDKVDDHACVKTLYFSSSLDGVRWVDNRPRDFSACQVFYGQTELVFAAPIHAKYIRINPTNWFRRPALRIELYGCDPPNNT